MKSLFNGEIAFGFLGGVLFMLLSIGALSYQVEHCGAVGGQTSASDEDQPTKPALPEKSEERRNKISEYNKNNPISCGIVGFVPSVIGMADSHEGFFIEILTLALAAFTAMLWGAGEKQRISSETTAALQRQASEKMGQAQVRAYLAFTEITLTQQ